MKELGIARQRFEHWTEETIRDVHFPRCSVVESDRQSLAGSLRVRRSLRYRVRRRPKSTQTFFTQRRKLRVRAGWNATRGRRDAATQGNPGRSGRAEPGQPKCEPGSTLISCISWLAASRSLMFRFVGCRFGGDWPWLRHLVAAGPFSDRSDLAPMDPRPGLDRFESGPPRRSRGASQSPAQAPRSAFSQTSPRGSRRALPEDAAQRCLGSQRPGKEAGCQIRGPA